MVDVLSLVRRRRRRRVPAIVYGDHVLRYALTKPALDVQRMEADSADAAFIPAAFTICAWVRATAIGSAGRGEIFECDDGTTGYRFRLHSSGAQLYVRDSVAAAVSAIYAAGSIVGTGQYHFIWGDCDGTNVRCGIDGGAPDVSAAMTGGVGVGAGKAPAIGTLSGGVGFTTSMTGEIADIRLFSAKLADADREAIRTSGGAARIQSGIEVEGLLRPKSGVSLVPSRSYSELGGAAALTETPVTAAILAP